MTATFAAPLPRLTAVRTPMLQRCGGRQCPLGTCDHQGTLLRRSSTGYRGSTGVPSIVHQVLRSSGQPLDGGTRTFMEARLGHDFSRVRVHTSARAAESAQAVAAHAYTVGQDIVFGAGQYAPVTAEGRRLLAHELTHVVQQGSGLHRAAPSAVGDAGDASEREAAAVAQSVADGGSPAVTHSDPAPMVRRQGTLSCALVNAPYTGAPTCVNMGGCRGSCVLRNPFPLPPYCTCEPGGATWPIGPIPGAPSPPLTSPGLPAPPAPAPTPTPPSAPPAPPAPQPVIRFVEVENSREAITYQVPSSLGAGGRQHWVTIAGTRPDVLVQAVVDPPVPAGDPRLAAFRWESDPAGQIAPGADALHATAPVPTARKVVVRAVLGASHAELTLWAVFVRVRATAGPTMAAPSRVGTQLRLRADINLEGRIFPADIITDADRPSLHGANTVHPPGGTNICGRALAGGANHRWDMSRQRRLRNVDPDGILPAMGAVVPPACLNTPSDYPVEPEVGNDDTHPGDERNNPYAGGGVITSSDPPGKSFDDSVGADGNTFERHLQFREFARLEFNRTWWKVSPFFPWRVHYRIVKVGGQWQDNGSDAAADNAGF